MTKVKFKKNTNYDNLVLDFDIPSENKHTCKKYISSYSRRIPYHYFYMKSYLYSKEQEEQKRKKRAHDLWIESNRINKYPRPDHFWAYTYNCCNFNNKMKLDKLNKNLVISGHYIAIQQTFGSSIGTQLFKYNSPKISTLWKVEFLRNKYKKIYETKQIPILNKSYNFIIKNNNKITKRYIKIINVSEECRDCPNVFNTKDLL